MNTKWLIVLVLLAVAAVMAVLWLDHSPETEELTQQAMVPGLKQDINEVTFLRVIKGGNQTVADLNRTEAGWVVSNKKGYPANTSQIRDTLLTLANAELLEAKTAKADLYGQLGVQDVSQENATGVQIAIEGIADPVSLIVGDIAAAGTGGTYVRRPNEAQSWLVTGILSIPQETTQWLDRSILDIAANRIQAITIQQPSGEKLEVEKQSRDQEHFTVLHMPEGRQLASESVADSLGDALANLQLEDVVPVEQIHFFDEKFTQVNYRTFDGLIIVARAFQQDDTHYVHFAVSFDENQAQRFRKADTSAKAQAADSVETNPQEEKPEEPGEERVAESSDSNASKPQEQELDKDEIAKLRTEARQLNERLIPWGYAIAAYQYENMTKRMDDLLEQSKADAERDSIDDPSAETSSQQAASEKASLTKTPIDNNAEAKAEVKPTNEPSQSEKPAEHE